MGIATDCSCPICGIQPENVAHLFFECTYSVECGTAVLKWLSFSHCKSGLNALLRWVQRTASSDFRRRVAYTAIAAIVYHVWKARNTCIWQLQVPSIQKLVKDIQGDVKYRVQHLISKKVSSSDLLWFHSL
ncbi:uncharacterized protein [Spinacia oleracea]|uniref:Reverse transcriptase zinc-binding domain-containing protein n=1 Tax=Spinacia oleracea TaxID=3562 RepID=A0A9R0J6S7_SPIOL|nr:uncharacterized protein LOC110801242 [Spinacia oleracea]